MKNRCRDTTITIAVLIGIFLACDTDTSTYNSNSGTSSSTTSRDYGAITQWTTDLSGDAPMAYVQRGDVLLAVTCFPSNKERIVMLRSNMVQDLLDGESMVSFSWNGSSENSDMATGRILDGFGERQLWLEDSGNLISKIRRYASVEIGFIKLVGASENRTLTLKGSTNAINSVYRACGYR